MTNSNSKLAKNFDPQTIEKFWLSEWNQNNLTKVTFDSTKMNFSIHLPPPNVTGVLHMGHAFNQTIIDILLRYHRMCGDNTLCIPGTDHAGIATQIVVERQLNTLGKSLNDLGKDDFIKYTWDWKEKSRINITKQMRRLGSSVDWTREYFTMDDKMSSIVIEIFVKLYEQGLIYRGKRIVNWDPKLLTALSDIEVVLNEEDSYLWYIKYPLDSGIGTVTVTTTRPETIFGDTAIMVNPKDKRYVNIVGQNVIVPLCNRLIPIISDEYVNIEFGTGIVKVTPAHDFNDYQIGQRHHLSIINILTPNAHINENAPSNYHGLDRYTARDKIVSDLNKMKLLKAVIPYRTIIPRSERTGVIIEPILTDQWFIAMNKPSSINTLYPGKSIAEIAFNVVKNGEIVFIPPNWTNIYYQWLENIKDWCISRQLWWGHQIPAWYDTEGNVYVARNELDAQVQARKNGFNGNLQRDKDVLDTWFSSSLIPFASLGWPNSTLELKYFLPSSVIVTGFDIIFFWVARMIMLTKYFTGKIPFQTVYIHGLLRDAQGNKMSKSKGNVLDPIDIIDGISIENLIKKRISNSTNTECTNSIIKTTYKEYPQGIKALGTDALRFTFASIATLGQNINFSLTRCAGYRNFCNKLWNVTRFVLMNCEDHDCAKDLYINKCGKNVLLSLCSQADRWIISVLQKLVFQVEKNFKDFRIDNIANAIYYFVWHEYCSWYVELAKIQLQKMEDPRSQSITRNVLLYILETILRLVHPIIPFITEELWQKIIFLNKLNNRNYNSIMIQNYPKSILEIIDVNSEIWINELKLITNACRNLRNIMKLPSSQYVTLISNNNSNLLKEFAPYLQKLANLSTIEIINDLTELTNKLSSTKLITVGNFQFTLKK